MAFCFKVAFKLRANLLWLIIFKRKLKSAYKNQDQINIKRNGTGLQNQKVFTKMASLTAKS